MKIAVASGKGGTGKTFLATNLFYALQQEERSPTLVDCDAEEPNTALFFSGRVTHSCDVVLQIPEIDANRCTYCGKCHEYCLYHAIFILPHAKIIRVMEEFCHGCGACVYACGEGAIKEKALVLGQVDRYALAGKSTLVVAKMKVGLRSPVKVIQAGINEVIHDPIVIMDSPPGTSCPFIQTVARADYVVLVTEPTPFGLSDLKQSIETLKSLKKPCGVVINRAGMGDRAVYDYLDRGNIPLLMEIPFDKSIAESYAHGKLQAGRDRKWRTKLSEMYNKLSYSYGNSHYQR